MPEEIELVWDDYVAPETCIDFDAPQFSGLEVLAMFGTAIGFLFGCYGLVVLSDPKGRNPAASKEFVLSKEGRLYDLGLDEE